MKKNKILIYLLSIIVLFGNFQTLNADTFNINVTVCSSPATNLAAVQGAPSSGDVTLTWNISVTPNVNEQILDIIQPDLTTVTIDPDAPPGTPLGGPGDPDSYTLTGLQIGATYTAQLYSTAGTIICDPAELTFVVAPAAITPPVLAPEPAETPGTTNTLSWDVATYDSGDPVLNPEYYIEVSTNPGFTTIYDNSGWILITDWEFTGLSTGTTYFYRVKSKNDLAPPYNLESHWSNIEFSLQGSSGGGGGGGGGGYATCGDGNLDDLEECDDGNRTSGDGCSSGCMLELQICGNGTVEAPEQCDDGNTINGDGCSSTCTVEGSAGPLCGNGILNPGEECDDGNTINGDGCSSSCSLEAECGNGALDPGEECDDGNTINGDGCTSTCLMEGPGPECGNGLLEITEECDDGNTTSGDGCTAACEVEHSAPLECGNGTLDVGEECDDGNTTDGDGCSAFCVIEEEPEAVCGNGILEEPEEECDDGNTINDDGCSATCELEEIVDIIIEIRGAPEHRKTDLPLNENGFAEDRQVDGQQAGFFDGISTDLFRITNTPNLGLNAQLDIFKPSINNLDVLGVNLDNWGYTEVPVTIVTGTYDFGLNGEAHNSRVINAINIDEDTERIILDFTRGETTKLVAGDTRDDNYVNALDIATMLASYKATGANLNDLNKDESPIVNAIDIAILIWNYKATGETF